MQTRPTAQALPTYREHLEELARRRATLEATLSDLEHAAEKIN